MKNKLNTFLTAAGALLGVAGLVLILLSVFRSGFPLYWGLLCVVLGSLCSVGLMLRTRKGR